MSSVTQCRSDDWASELVSWRDGFRAQLGFAQIRSYLKPYMNLEETWYKYLCSLCPSKLATSGSVDAHHAKQFC